jgi:SH3-like domain-containing protein
LNRKVRQGIRRVREELSDRPDSVLLITWKIYSVKYCRSFFAWRRLLLLLAGLVLLPACGRGKGGPKEMVYVSAPQAFLRDQVAAVYNKTGSVKNGEAVQVLARDRRFARVRTSTGAEGWLEQRYLVSTETYDALQKLAEQMRNEPVQATGVAHNQTNIHLDPQRDAEHLYQLDQGAKLSVMKRAGTEKPLPAGQSQPTKKGQAEPAAPPMEDWWLIRDEAGHVGWVLARMVDIDIPMEIAQYAEGQRTVAAFVLNEVTDRDKTEGERKVPQYLVLFSENKDGMPFDFNQVRVFTWNVKRHRYETAYREHGLNGVLPVTVSHETFDKEGDLPVFVVRVKDDAGNVTERKYKLNTPIVRRVLAPGEQKELARSPAPRRRSSAVRKKKRH